MAAAVVGLLYVGRQAYSNPAFRRTVGILWDVGTFWPRATHPLAPPCYAERTVPDLTTRIEYIRKRGGQVVLSCHSQGSVIGAAVLAQLSTECFRAAAFLSYGSPLARIYARFFPAYFGARALRRIGELLVTAEPVSTRATATPSSDGAEPAGDQTDWPWRNLLRRSDPIGGPIFLKNPPDAGTEPIRQQAQSPTELVDWILLDPLFAKPPGDTSYPASYGHSNYFVDPAFNEAIGLIRRPATVEDTS